MLWKRKYIIKSYIRFSLWIVPFFAVLAYMVVNRITYYIGKWLLQTGRIDETTAFLGLSMAATAMGIFAQETPPTKPAEEYSVE